MKALCDDGNNNGLVTNIAINKGGALKQNLAVVKEVLSALLASKAEYMIVMVEMPI